MRFIRAATVVAVLVGVIGCHRSKSYQANVEVTRSSVVRKDDKGVPLTIDFELSYVDCPGTQLEVVRGDAAFAACVGKYKVGERVPLAIEHVWAPEGHYRWIVHRVGDCDRTPDPNDEASYALVRECDDWMVNGQRVGFQCRYVPEKKLIDKCPWFRRH